MRSAVGAHRIHQVGGVAEQGDASPAPVRQRIAVDHRVLQDQLVAGQQVADVEPAQVPVGEERQHVLQAPVAVPVGLVVELADGGARHHAHPVHQRLAFGRVTRRDRIGDQARPVLVVGDDHGLAVEEAVELGDAAPHGDPTVGQRPLVGMQVRADRRMDAVGADQHIGTERLGLAVSVAGADQHAAVALLDTLHAETGAYRLLAEALAHRGEQDHLQFAAMDRVLRIGVAGFHPARLGPYRGAALVDVAQLVGGDGGGRQRRAEAQFGKGLDRRRLDIDADAKGAYLAAAFQQRDLADAGLVQGQGATEAADAGAGDENIDGFAHGCFLFSSVRIDGGSAGMDDRLPR